MASNGTVTIREVVSSKDQKEFMQLPHRIYADYPAWVAPLNMDLKKIFSPKYPFRDHSEMKFFLAEKNGQVVGRIAAVVDADFVKKWDARIGHFGFFESVNDLEVAKALIDTAENFLKERKMIWETYYSELKGFFEMQAIRPNCSYNYSYFAVLFTNEEKMLQVRKVLNEKEIYPRRYFYPSLDRLEYIRVNNECKNSINISSRILCLPIYPGLDAKVQDVIISTLKSNF